MGRFRIGIGLLAVLLVISIGTQIGMAALQKPVKQSLAAAMTAAETEDYAQAGEKTAEAYTRWQRSRTFCAALCDHAFMEDIEGNLAMRGYGRRKRKRRISAPCVPTPFCGWRRLKMPTA